MQLQRGTYMRQHSVSYIRHAVTTGSIYETALRIYTIQLQHGIYFTHPSYLHHLVLLDSLEEIASAPKFHDRVWQTR